MMDLRGGTRDGAVNRTLDTPEQDRIESQPVEAVSPIEPSVNHKRGPSESQNLLPNSPRNLLEYSTTTRYRLDDHDNTRYEPRGIDEYGGKMPKWSGVPRNLKRSSGKRWRDAAIDVLAISASMPFFALASALLWVDGEDVSDDKNNTLHQLIIGAATLFPLIFSVIVGRTTVKIASWKTEHGISIGLLERLLGSRTVGGTLMTAASLRSITFTSLVLVFVWLLSPAGSQGIFRTLSITTISISGSGSATYINTRQQSYLGQAQFNGWSNGLATILSASVLAPNEIKTSPVDTWGKFKIPIFSSLNETSQGDDGWRSTSDTSELEYSSLIGITISDMPGSESSFTVESTYVELTCTNMTSTMTRNSEVFIDPSLISSNGPFISSQDLTSTTPWMLGYLGTNVTSVLPNTTQQALDTIPVNSTSAQDVLPGLLLYQDFTGTQNVASISCTPSQVYVESSVTCSTTPNTTTPQSCAVTAQRLSLLPHLQTNITPFSIANLFLALTSFLPAATPQLNNIDIMQNYIVSPLDNAFIQSAQYPMFSSPPGESRFLNLPLHDFSVRFSQIINTVLQGSTANATTYLTSSSSIPANTTTLSSTPQSLTSAIHSLSPFITVPTTTLTPHTIFTISYPWLAIFLLATTVMLIASLISLILTQITLLPSYLPHISNILRDCPNVAIPAGGIGVGGGKRARDLGSVMVRLGDVGDVDGGFEIGVGAAVRVGRVGIGMLGLADGRGGVRGLDRRKLYL